MLRVDAAEYGSSAPSRNGFTGNSSGEVSELEGSGHNQPESPMSILLRSVRSRVPLALYAKRSFDYAVRALKRTVDRTFRLFGLTKSNVRKSKKN